MKTCFQFAAAGPQAGSPHKLTQTGGLDRFDVVAQDRVENAALSDVEDECHGIGLAVDLGCRLGKDVNREIAAEAGV